MNRKWLRPVDGRKPENHHNRVPDHTSNTTLAAVRWDDAAAEVALRPANHRPPPSPGFWESSARLFYVSELGHVWMIRSADGRVQLSPAEIPEDSVEVSDDVLHDPDITTVAEAADELAHRIAPGVYADQGLHYYVSDRGVWMLYGLELVLVELPFLPPSAKSLDVVPADVVTVIMSMEASA
ncbi:MAG: hypothetical protein H6729_00050 [Deltaproteobacteria bacterium]|nr:hypothetical protein [Deltaproteobacteria bacterium]